MKKLRKLLFKKIQYFGVQCPYHRPQYTTIGHEDCLKRWLKQANKDYKNSFEYKQTEIINELIDELNKKPS